MAIKFGTDGWRAIIAEDFTFDNVRLCAQGAAGPDEVPQPSVSRLHGRLRHALRVRRVRRRSRRGNGGQRHTHIPMRQGSANARNRLQPSRQRRRRGCGHNRKPQSGRIQRLQVQARLRRQRVARNRGGTGIAHRRRRIVGRCAAHITRSGNRQRLARNIRPAPDYLNHVASFVDLAAIRSAGLDLIVDSMHGAGAGYLADLLSGGLNARHRNPPRTQPRLPRHGAARTPRAQPRSPNRRDWRPNRRHRTRHRRRRRPAGRRGRRRQLPHHAANLRPALHAPARHARQARPPSPLHHHDRHDRQARRNLRCAGARNPRRLQVPRPRHDGSGTHS